MIQRVAYLHGLESHNLGPKNDYLHQRFEDVYDPRIDYFEADIFRKLLKAITTFQPDLIIGSSMGGRFAYHIANLLQVDSLLFNPALITKNERVKEVDIIFSKSGNNLHHIILGKADQVVSPQDSQAFLKEHCQHYQVTLLPHAHRTAYDLFVDSIEKVCK